MQHNIRRPLFDGMREVHAIWFDVALIGEQEARRRVLGHWQVGARLYLIDGGYLLALPRPKFANCGSLDGLALCQLDQILSSAPLAPDEKAGIPHGGCWLVRAAKAQAYTLADADRVDAAHWIDLSAIVLRTPLAVPESKARVRLEAPEKEQSLRDILDDVIPPPSPNRDKFLRELKAAASKKQGSQGGGGAAAAAAAGAGILAGLLGRLFRGRSAGAGSGSQSGAESAWNGATAEPEWKQRLFAAAASIAALTRMSKVIGWRQAAYMRKMIDMFERGDISDALRHAIPLDGDGTSLRQALGTPRARSNLDITPAGGTTAAIGMDAELQNYLRQSYRQLFARLEREGRIDEATYVLAELLKSGVEAVDFLEKHGRLKQAAQLAQTLDLAPEIKVRLWFLAGDTERAIRTARLYGAFADAVRRLEKHQDGAADALREQWAEYLAERGDLAEAADAIWPLKAKRYRALDWLLQAEQVGRQPGARALARKLLLMPEALADSLPAIIALLDAPGEDGARVRASLAADLVALGEQSTATRRLAGELLRHLIIDRSAGMNMVDRKAVKELTAIADAAMLRSDLPPIEFAGPAPGAALASLAQPLQVQGGERGLLQIYDARRLPDGHYLLALGESGLVRVNAQGRQVVHFPLPAFHLVLAKNGERALALARRGDVIRASRIDLTTCKASDWISHPIDAWADQYDGVVWNAVIANRIVAIDTSKDGLSVIWQVADLPGKVVDFLDNGASQTVLISGPDGLEQWRYMLPERRLAQRDSITAPSDDVAKVMAHAASTFPMQVRVTQNDAGVTLSARRPGGTELQIALGAINDALAVEIKDGWLVVLSHIGGGQCRCLVADRNVNKIVADLRLMHADHPAISANDNHLLLFDRAGRLLDIDTTTAKVHSLTLS